MFDTFDWQRVFLNDLPMAFLGEVTFRVIFAYFIVFAFLKISGRRGIRQLSLFELVVILTLGSAAGDVTFYEDVPLLPVATVFIVMLLIYRLTTYVVGRSARVSKLVEGVPVTLIRDGLYELESLAKLNISEDEFFMELRQCSVEHLGQVRLAIVELDGDLSLYYFDKDQVRPGLSVLPHDHRADCKLVPASGLYACNHCGETQQIAAHHGLRCPRCDCETWSAALDTLRNG